MKLKGKVALITGSSRGIGKSTALLFAKEGAKIVVNYLDSEKEAFAVVEKIKKIGSEAIAIKCDVSKEDKVKEMINQTIDKFGKIDILVNNAGIVFDVPFFEKTVKQFKRTLDVNLLGTFLCSKYASEQMLKNNDGKIINVSSTNGINSFTPDSMDYDASKAGINILTRDLAKELAPKIQVNSIAPGYVDTDMNKDLPLDFIEEETKKIYSKRFAKPEEIAKSILFLASDDASYITGSILKADGGYS
ncbi:MAG: 3-oxoacyl-ACP reductase FabG [Candidatus Aenigmarchaeota archaeon]|nr:3-oxoacyl-ACP reductase FabG [Candidatus Aenigmarchaeota archaeon]